MDLLRVESIRLKRSFNVQTSNICAPSLLLQIYMKHTYVRIRTGVII